MIQILITFYLLSFPPPVRCVIACHDDGVCYYDLRPKCLHWQRTGCKTDACVPWVENLGTWEPVYLEQPTHYGSPY